jgi:hypothetical protein
MSIVISGDSPNLTSPNITGAVLSSMASSVITSGTAVASTSGTSIDFTSIPSWVKRITVMANGVSTNGSSNLQMQVGAGSVTTSGYVGTVIQSGGGGSAAVTFTSGLGVTASNASSLTSTGIAIFTLLSTNTWVGTSVTTRSDGYSQIGSTTIALSGTLDRIRITTFNGTDTFDAGTINITYE